MFARFFLVHLALAVILTGALVSAREAQRGYIYLSKGESRNSFTVNGQSHNFGFEVYLDDFILDWKSSHKDVSSSVLIRKNGKTLRSANLRVNSPFLSGGYMFYQVGFDPQNLSRTTILVAKDPGAPIVFFGFLLLNTGVFIMLAKK